jgi:L-rhamnose mutarotase
LRRSQARPKTKTNCAGTSNGIAAMRERAGADFGCVYDYGIFPDETTYHLFAVLKRRDDHATDAFEQFPIVLKWRDYMADIMATGEGMVPAQPPLVSLFHLP